jgi:hypothetical protein
VLDQSLDGILRHGALRDETRTCAFVQEFSCETPTIDPRT